MKGDKRNRLWQIIHIQVTRSEDECLGFARREKLSTTPHP